MSRTLPVKISVLAAIVVALLVGARLTVHLAAQAACFPFACFEPGTEGEVWQALVPVGHVNDQTLCVNSDRNDNNLPVQANRTCTDPTSGLQVPPPLGSFLYPYAIAVDGKTIFANDQFNHRIQALLFDGTPIPLTGTATGAIGDGTFGSDLTHLNGPEGLAIASASKFDAQGNPVLDAQGNPVLQHVLAVADAYNGRLAIFNTADGAPTFGQHYPLFDLTGGVTLPTGIAMSPGTVINPGANLSSDPHRIVVTDRLNCYVYILDAGLNVLRRIPDVTPDPNDPVLGQFTVDQGGCLNPSIDQTTGLNILPPLGYFGSATGAAIDASGHVFIADFDNSRIQILDLSGNPLVSFGTPPDPSTLPANAPLPPGTLQHPWAVLIDHLGRIGVTDFLNNRVAYFSPFDGVNPPTFLFQLNAAGTLNGFPTGIAEQVSADTDPAGRLLVSDLRNHRIQRFQLPDLAIAKVTVDPTSNPASGTYEVIVPSQKVAPVLGVQTTVQGVNATATSPVAQSPANPAAPNDIQPGQFVTYAFTYNPTGSPVSFLFDATGNSGNTHAPELAASPTAACVGCSTSAAILRVSDGTAATLSGGWYNVPLDVRITAASVTPSLASIAYQFTSGPSVGTYGGAVHFANVSPTGGSIDLAVSEVGTSSLQYWAINADGSVEQPRHTLNLSLDLSAPTVAFGFPTPTGQDAAGNPWYKSGISVSVSWSDALSGATTLNSTLSFPSEGRGLFQTVQGVDRAGNSTGSIRTDQPVIGQSINIDTHAPTFSASFPASVTLELTGPGIGAVISSSPFASWLANPSLIASDPQISAGVNGSGVVSINAPAVGTTFPGPTVASPGPKTTVQSFTITDGAGNTATKSLNVIVQDTTKPALSCGAPISLSLSGVLGVVTSAVPNVLAQVTASDLSGSVTLAQSPLVGSAPFGIGPHNVTVTATDPSGNASTCVVVATVGDVTPPTITVPNPGPSVTTTGASTTAVVNYTVTATDNVTSPQSVTCSPASGSAFPIGTTTVNCSATDAAGNNATKSFTVQVVGNNLPTINVPANMTVEATSPSGAAVTFTSTPTWTDTVDGSGNASCTPANGSTFAIATTTVTCSFTNSRGGSASKTFTVTVRDSTPPVLTVPASQTVEATSASGAAVTYTVTATDIASAPVVVTCAPLSGSTFAFGTTTVSCTGKDSRGNVSAASTFTITVRDTTPPVLTLPTPPIVEATGSTGAIVLYTVTATDAASTPVTVTCTPASGLTFALGSTTVGCTAKDSRGNTSAVSSFVVTVRDTTPPVVTVPANQTVAATSTSGATVSYTATATDLVDGSRPVTCTPASGTVFPVGTTTVTCSGATDTHGNTAPAKTFTVTITNQPPVVTQSNITAVATSSAGATVTFAPTVVDASDPNPVLTCSPASGTKFPIGSTPVTCTAKDKVGLSASVTFTVTVTHSAPVCTAAVASTTSLWPPNHQLVPITVKGLTTADGGTITTVIRSIYQDEYTDGLGDGDTPIDGFGVGTSTAQVRAERSGSLDGRVYYIGFTATTAGGSCNGIVTVGVPHYQGHAAVGEGAKYDSTKESLPPNDTCHGQSTHGHHDGDGCIPGHHGDYAGDKCLGKNGYHHDGDGCIAGHHGHYDGDNCKGSGGYHHDGDGHSSGWNGGYNHQH